MSVGNSLLVALIVMSIVFSCLIALCVLVKVQSFIFSFIENNKKAEETKEEVSNNSNLVESNTEECSGELKLIGVDEKTAAMIMAIVSDELKIPLNELEFKSIKLSNS
jgi:Na+-transporting methylmalonyl-CoA/oxaloacetate decarboxylase gamma subunit